MQVAHLLTSDLAEVGLTRVQTRQLQKLAGSGTVAGQHVVKKTYKKRPGDVAIC